MAAEREGANGGELDAPVCGPKHVAQLLKIVGSRSLNVKDDKETKVGLRIPELFLVFVVGDSADGGQVPRLRSYSARGWRECLGEWLRVIGGLKKCVAALVRHHPRHAGRLLSDEPKMQELALGARDALRSQSSCRTPSTCARCSTRRVSVKNSCASHSSDERAAVPSRTATAPACSCCVRACGRGSSRAAEDREEESARTAGPC